MRKHSHQPASKKPNPVILGLGLGYIDSSFELPAADDFVCSDEEVREAFAELEGAHESFLD